MANALETEWCNNMVQTLATSSFGFLQLRYYVPGLIPNRDGSLARVHNYTSAFQSNVVKDALQATIDCYSSQKIEIFANSIDLESIHCLLQKAIQRVSIRQNCYQTFVLILYISFNQLNIQLTQVLQEQLFLHVYQ
ncbi:Hypothetical_protein [Hexamita inflata]|uniref:Hypothetical_protein n=1 Tax=Hexamita inflata TaxID=28002 RepID=A0AA86PN40_9EUKA|nr:Hypothetical protein HINF_LOCUS29323 [Hexamita inflata]